MPPVQVRAPGMGCVRSRRTWRRAFTTDMGARRREKQHFSRVVGPLWGLAVCWCFNSKRTSFHVALELEHVESVDLRSEVRKADAVLPAFAREGQRGHTLKRVAWRGRCRLLFRLGVQHILCKQVEQARDLSPVRLPLTLRPPISTSIHHLLSLYRDTQLLSQKNRIPRPASSDA